MATRSKPLIDSNPALVLGVIVFLVFLVGGGAAMYALAPLVDSDTAATEAVADDGG